MCLFTLPTHAHTNSPQFQCVLESPVSWDELKMVYSSSMGQFNDCEPSLIDNIKYAGLHWYYKQMLGRGVKDNC